MNIFRLKIIFQLQTRHFFKDECSFGSYKKIKSRNRVIDMRCWLNKFRRVNKTMKKTAHVHIFIKIHFKFSLSMSIYVYCFHLWILFQHFERERERVTFTWISKWLLFTDKILVTTDNQEFMTTCTIKLWISKGVLRLNIKLFKYRKK